MVYLVYVGAYIPLTTSLHARTTGTTKDLQDVQYGKVDELSLARVVDLRAFDDDWSSYVSYACRDRKFEDLTRMCRQVDTPCKCRCSA